jgi:hypothetical protein
MMISPARSGGMRSPPAPRAARDPGGERWPHALRNRGRDAARMTVTLRGRRRDRGARSRPRSELARRVRALAGRRDDAVDARDVDNARIVARVQQRQEGARHAHDGVEVDRHQPVEVGLAHLLEGAADGDAGVVDEQVDAAVLRPHFLGERPNGGAVGDVHASGRGAHAERLGLARSLVEAGGVDVEELEPAAAARERERNAAADAARCAGDDCDPVAQLHGGWPA